MARDCGEVELACAEFVDTENLFAQIRLHTFLSPMHSFTALASAGADPFSSTLSATQTAKRQARLV